MSQPAYFRILLKVSGESFAPPSRLRQVVREIAQAAGTGCEVAVVVGGGNIMRGRQTDLIDRVSADHAGMVATLVNGIVLEQLLVGSVPARHFSALEVKGIVPRFDARAARAELSRKTVLVLSGGTGNPLFSTDTAAALRAREVGAQVLLKGTKVKGVYSADPERDRQAKFLPRVSYEQALRQGLEVMDRTAFAVCAESRMPIIVFDMFKSGNLAAVIRGEAIGSKVC
jgi:uridylate kinase